MNRPKISSEFSKFGGIRSHFITLVEISTVEKNRKGLHADTDLFCDTRHIRRELGNDNKKFFLFTVSTTEASASEIKD